MQVNGYRVPGNSGIFEVTHKTWGGEALDGELLFEPQTGSEHGAYILFLMICFCICFFYQGLYTSLSLSLMPSLHKYFFCTKVYWLLMSSNSLILSSLIKSLLKINLIMNLVGSLWKKWTHTHAMISRIHWDVSNRSHHLDHTLY